MSEDESKNEPALTTEPSFTSQLTHSLATISAFITLAIVSTKLEWHKASHLPSNGIGLSLFTVIVFGLVIITTFAAVSWPLRVLVGKIPVIGKILYEQREGMEAEGLLSCPLCTGMWIGSIVSVIGFSVFQIQNPLDVIMHGFLGAGTTWLLYTITNKLGAYN